MLEALMKGRRFAPSLRYDLRTKLIVLMLVNLLLFLGNSIAYEAFLTLDRKASCRERVCQYV